MSTRFVWRSWLTGYLSALSYIQACRSTISLLEQLRISLRIHSHKGVMVAGRDMRIPGRSASSTIKGAGRPAQIHILRRTYGWAHITRHQRLPAFLMALFRRPFAQAWYSIACSLLMLSRIAFWRTSVAARSR